LGFNGQRPTLLQLQLLQLLTFLWFELKQIPQHIKIKMEELPPYGLEVTPDSALQLVLTRGNASEGTSRSPSSNDGTTRCVITIRHTGKTNEHLAFKVKTTQPRRYLVRPNQGIIAPGGSELISVLLVEKDKQVLLQSYDRLGQAALDHSKDKFLIQSCVAPTPFATKFLEQKSIEDASGESKASKDMADALTALWNEVGSSTSTPTFNKKLQVKLVVDSGAGGEGATAKTAADGAKPTPALSDKTKIETMTPEQMFAEITSLRRKYDELVSFSVNLTAERDILNNTLEQTKRDLNREMAARAALENGSGRQALNRGKKETSKKKISFKALLLASTATYLLGVRNANNRSVKIFASVPVLKSFLGFDAIKAGISTPLSTSKKMKQKSSEL